MAFLSKKPFSILVLALCLFFFFSLFQPIHSLSTVAISENSGQTLVCAVTKSPSERQLSHLNCTSFPRGVQIPMSPLNSSISGIVAGNGFVCAVRSQPSPSIMGCWRFSPAAVYPEEKWSYKRIYHGLPIDDLSAGNSHICGITSGGLECWQWEEFNSPIPDCQNFTSVAVGEDFVCGLSEFGNIKCLPRPENNSNNNTVSGHEPIGNYSVIAAGFRHACAISVSDGSLECWGDTAGENPPKGEFTTLALGENRGCAMRPNGTVTCWGDNKFRLPEHLSSTYFIGIEAKQSIFCGVRSSDFSLLCWGNEIFENSNSTVLDNVVPGPCRSACPCMPLPGYGSYCSQGQKICQPCVSESSPILSTPPPPPQGTTGGGGGSWNKKMVAFLVVGCVGSASLLAVCCFLFYRYCNVRGCRVHDSGPLDMEANTRPQPPPAAAAAPVLEKKLSHLVSAGNGSHLEEFPLHLLLKATNNFWDDHKIGTGSFGSVYHAILDDGREVAIKRAETMAASSQGGTTKRQQDDKDSAFVSELEFLSRLNHKNLVKLLGYCEESGELILVYEYMRNGTLHDHLHNLEGSPLMSWQARIKVALDAARGIEYLHVYAVPQIIHRDIKSSNILLDDTWNAKVSDFGLSLMSPQDEESHLSLRAAGTVGYMDPEYYRLQQLTPKSDVYSFGVVLLEILSGYKAIHQNEYGVPRNVVDFLAPYIIQEEIHRVLDPKVPPPTPFEIEAVAYVGYIAVDCVMPEGRYRPTISEIVNSLERALANCSPPSPQLSRSTTGSITEIGNSLDRAQAAGSPPSPSGPPPSPQLCRSTTGSST
ncbi:hypothetical protein RHGRI_031484 [Rhododendron griersonianum]|uniref:non-specific serine/threonine protein kinase n=1 Tax=Rhododendron griersonianum TaxID=479676 RepID=A0AAV6I848_9ERIC|nr:hypothetical protein RHGRI_031484 [Rhododendron griersonianum]